MGQLLTWAKFHMCLWSEYQVSPLGWGRCPAAGSGSGSQKLCWGEAQSQWEDGWQQWAAREGSSPLV